MGPRSLHFVCAVMLVALVADASAAPHPHVESPQIPLEPTFVSSAFSGALIATEEDHPLTRVYLPAESSSSQPFGEEEQTATLQAVSGQSQNNGKGAAKNAAPTPPPSASATAQANAHEAVMRFMQGIKLASLPEGKQLLSQTQWIVGPADYGRNIYSRPDYTEATSIFASLFDTDVPTVSGYKELFELKAVTEAGGAKNLKLLVVAYQDRSDETWKVVGSIDNSYGDSSLDMDESISYFTKELNYSRTPLKDSYGAIGHWQLLKGQLLKAQDALRSAQTASDNVDDLSHTDLRIAALLSVIEKITPAPKPRA
jgi:hypothetical protein